MKNPLKTIEKGMDTATDMHYSGVEEGNILNTRLASDNEHLITRLTRPIIALALLGLFVFSFFMSANGVDVNPDLVKILKASFPLVLGFYFGSRGIEKVMKIWKQDARQDRQSARQERKNARIIRRNR
jgi:hypothetical protein